MKLGFLRTCYVCNLHNYCFLIGSVFDREIVTAFDVLDFDFSCHASWKTCVSFACRRQNLSCVYPLFARKIPANCKMQPPCWILTNARKDSRDLWLVTILVTSHLSLLTGGALARGKGGFVVLCQNSGGDT